MPEKEDSENIEMLLKEVKEIQQQMNKTKPIDLSDSKLRNELIKKEGVIYELNQELESRRKLNDKFELLFGVFSRQLNYIKNLRSSLKSSKYLGQKMEEGLRKKRNLVLNLKEKLGKTEQEISLIKVLLKKEVLTNKDSLIKLEKLGKAKGVKEKEYKELLGLFKKQMIVMDNLKEQLKGENGRIQALIKEDTSKEVIITNKNKLIFKLKKDIFLANKILHEGFENDEFLKDLGQELKAKPEELISGKINPKKWLYLLKSLKKELAEKEKKIIKRDEEIKLVEKDALELQNESEAFKKRLDAVESTNKSLMRENFELSNKTEFLNRAMSSLKSKNERLDLEYGKSMNNLKQEYGLKIKRLMKEKVEEEVRIRASSLREDPLKLKDGDEEKESEEYNKLKEQEKSSEQLTKKHKHSQITLAKKGTMNRIKSHKEHSLFGSSTKIYSPKHEELVPLIKIALEHGESKEKVKESLLNSGHERILVDKALSKF